MRSQAYRDAGNKGIDRPSRVRWKDNKMESDIYADGQMDRSKDRQMDGQIVWIVLCIYQFNVTNRLIFKYFLQIF